MNFRIVMVIVLGGVFGVVVRFYILGLFFVYWDFLVGILMVNSIVSFIFGYFYGFLFWGFDVLFDWRVFFGMGFCGVLSIFLMFFYEIFLFLCECEYFIVIFNILVNVIIIIVLVFVGFMLVWR